LLKILMEKTHLNSPHVFPTVDTSSYVGRWHQQSKANWRPPLWINSVLFDLLNTYVGRGHVCLKI